MNSPSKINRNHFFILKKFLKNLYLVRSLSGDFVDRPFGNSTGKFENFLVGLHRKQDTVRKFGWQRINGFGDRFKQLVL